MPTKIVQQQQTSNFLYDSRVLIGTFLTYGPDFAPDHFSLPPKIRKSLRSNGFPSLDAVGEKCRLFVELL